MNWARRKCALVLIATMLFAASMPALAEPTPASPLSKYKGKTYLTVDGPVGPAMVPGAPVLKTISAKYDVQLRTGFKVDIMPEFHFFSPVEKAVILRRSLVETDSKLSGRWIHDAPIRIPLDVQRTGAIVRGGWPCGPNRYHVTLKAWLEDAKGKKGNVLQYTIHCNELLMF